uniref:Uncharacterized protein n=1 Tax=Rhizophora mucronata TaxID=61149 RepID=A0A2P2R351_RHIMU
MIALKNSKCTRLCLRLRPPQVLTFEQAQMKFWHWKPKESTAA